ncbi:MAG: four helix bundle protein [Terriglobales bacterium]
MPEASSKPEQLRECIKAFAARIVRLYEALPAKTAPQVLGKQLLWSGTSVAANYRTVCRARTPPEFKAKIGVVLKEADESVFWLELLAETGVVSGRLEPLMKEARELTAIFTASAETARANL